MLELFCAATEILVGIISVPPNWLVLPDGTFYLEFGVGRSCWGYLFNVSFNFEWQWQQPNDATQNDDYNLLAYRPIFTLSIIQNGNEHERKAGNYRTPKKSQ